eukprot:GHVT01030807.1.p1 GENE.GHVT01030807.1~~GHVT01030807.1.p1  ORF type:complete len:105 (-),score=23.12 GHVT01030807.1:42-356(-)
MGYNQYYCYYFNGLLLLVVSATTTTTTTITTATTTTPTTTTTTTGYITMPLVYFSLWSFCSPCSPHFSHNKSLAQQWITFEMVWLPFFFLAAIAVDCVMKLIKP